MGFPLTPFTLEYCLVRFEYFLLSLLAELVEGR